MQFLQFFTREKEARFRVLARRISPLGLEILNSSEEQLDIYNLVPPLISYWLLLYNFLKNENQTNLLDIFP